jgi:hypothetical protein
VPSPGAAESLSWWATVRNFSSLRAAAAPNVEFTGKSDPTRNFGT